MRAAGDSLGELTTPLDAEQLQVIAFARGAHDAAARLKGRKKLWDQANHDRRQAFVTATVTAADAAHRSQFSPLSKERLALPPDRVQVFCRAFARYFDGPEAMKTPKRRDKWRLIIHGGHQAIRAGIRDQVLSAEPPLLQLMPPATLPEPEEHIYARDVDDEDETDA